MSPSISVKSRETDTQVAPPRDISLNVYRPFPPRVTPPCTARVLIFSVSLLALVTYTNSEGTGSRGGIAMMGATRPLGNIEESLVKANYGLAERGVGDARPFDHTTGVGHVDAHKGLYDDCINKE